MSKMRMRLVLSLLVVTGLAVAGWAGSSAVEAQSSMTGTWTASVSKDKDTSKINRMLGL